MLLARCPTAGARVDTGSLASASASNLGAGTAAAVAQSGQGPRPPSGPPLALGTVDRCRHGISPCRLGFVNVLALYGHYNTRVEMREAASYYYYQAAPLPTTDPLKPLEVQSYFEDVPYKTLQSHFEDVPYKTLYLDVDEQDGASCERRVGPACASTASTSLLRPASSSPSAEPWAPARSQNSRLSPHQLGFVGGLALYQYSDARVKMREAF
ncbi:hypothetical protein PsYK624_100870 [Phanerochaete sordida]|uniref:Uncharacterized protein n=1 Tax=Phanerochaete sordida TaxID=48140 RepID=A0A9P3GDY5_9APHY|nr:hypothetical protein PsYK624_100870 [Phanerochaete sordida]